MLDDILNSFQNWDIDLLEQSTTLIVSAMKKIVMFLMGLFFIGSSVVSADNDKAVRVEDMPQKAQVFISRYFGNLKVAYAKSEYDLFEKSYAVVFTTGQKLEFNGRGEWTDVDCRYDAVPVELVPQPIIDKINSLYSGAYIISIGRDRKRYDVKLSNRVELKFDRNGNLVVIDMD